MRPRLAHLLVSVLLVPVLHAATGCTGDDRDPGRGGAGDSPSASPDLARIRAGLAAKFAGDHAGDEDAAPARCFAAAFSDLVPAERLREAGVLDESFEVSAELPVLPRDVAEAWAEAQFECTDFVAESTRAQEALTRGAIDADAYARCLRRALTEAQMRAAVVAGLTGDFEADPVTALAKAQSSCARRATPGP